MGCAAGVHVKGLKDLGFEAEGTDYSKTFIKFCKNKYPDIEFEQKDMRKLDYKDKFDAIICLGAVIRGATPHFDFVAAEVSKGIANVSLETGKPIIYGVLTTDSIEQAIERAGTKSGNKGFDAAIAAIEMANLFKII